MFGLFAQAFGASLGLFSLFRQGWIWLVGRERLVEAGNYSRSEKVA